MRRGLLVAAFLLPLAGCVLPPDDGGYGQPYYGGSEVYPGYYYNEGSPYVIVEGAPAPLIYYGGSWGYYDHYHHFQRAPERVWRHLEERHPHGEGLRAWNGPHHPPGGQSGYRPPPSNGGYQGGPPGGGYRPPPSGGQPPQHMYQGQQPGQPMGQPMGQPHGQFQGQPPGQQPHGQFQGPPPGQPMGQPRPQMQQPAPRPAAPPPRQEEHRGGGNHQCPPGQHC